jgi:hypothetical protein
MLNISTRNCIKDLILVFLAIYSPLCSFIPVTDSIINGYLEIIKCNNVFPTKLCLCISYVWLVIKSIKTFQAFLFIRENKFFIGCASF